MDQLCAHVILLPVKSMHTSPICCSSQADKLALCTHKQTTHFPDIRDCFQSERQSLGSFTQKKKRKKKQKERKTCLSLQEVTLVYTHTHIFYLLSTYVFILTTLNLSFKSHSFAMFSPWTAQARKFFILVKLVCAGLSRFLLLFFLLCW